MILALTVVVMLGVTVVDDRPYRQPEFQQCETLGYITPTSGLANGHKRLAKQAKKLDGNLVEVTRKRVRGKRIGEHFKPSTYLWTAEAFQCPSHIVTAFQGRAQ